ncbi:hypothetical protein ACO0K9_24860 [Undibacterium sp. Ji50W]|uniref:hypothetical protein n=1 Tax=Undibacterium sp. Ji50W TaxID=3413041 RepID=UPI003BF45710
MPRFTFVQLFTAFLCIFWNKGIQNTEKRVHARRAILANKYSATSGIVENSFIYTFFKKFPCLVYASARQVLLARAKRYCLRTCLRSVASERQRGEEQRKKRNVL